MSCRYSRIAHGLWSSFPRPRELPEVVTVIFLASCMSVFPAQPASAQSLGTIEGAVLDGNTGTPLSGATVVITPADKARAKDTLRIQTDQNGTFRASHLPYGQYRLSVEKGGFLPAERGPIAIDLSASALWRRVDFKMQRLGTLCGQVLSRDRSALSGWTAEMIPYRGSRGPIAKSDSAGRFVVTGLSSGKYVLAVKPPMALGKTSADNRQDQGNTAWVRTFYPGTLYRQEATPIIISTGKDLIGYDIYVERVPMQHLRGEVLYAGKTPPVSVAVKLLPADRRDTLVLATKTRADGTFDFADVFEGSWWVVAEARVGNDSVRGFSAARIPRDTDVDGIRLELSAPFTLRGVVESVAWNRDRAVKKEKISPVYLLPVDGPLSQQAAAFPDRSGAFEIKSVYPGRYKILPAGVEPGFYLDSVTVGQADGLCKAVDLGDGTVPIRVIYKQGGGILKGVLNGESAATVILLPRDESLLDSQFIYRVAADAGKHFTMSGIRPGEYMLLAVASYDMDDLEDPTFVRALSRGVQTVSITDGSIVDVAISPVPWPK